MRSSFLDKLKGSDKAVDNSLPPDSSGVITRQIIKNFATQPSEELGVVLSPDAEVKKVIPDSIASKCNIPENFMIFSVNNTFVEDSSTFYRICSSTLTLTIQLQSVAPISEIIVEILDKEDKFTGDELQKELNFENRIKTTPRLCFLAATHPLFRRYTERLQLHRESRALLKQHLEERKKQSQRAILDELKRKEESLIKADEESEPQKNISMEEEKIDDEVRIAVKLSGQSNSEISAEECEEIGRLTDDESTEENDDISRLSADSPLEEEISPLVDILNRPNCDPKIPVSYVILPSEEYVLRSGEKTVQSLKKRIGCPPSPPS